MKTKDCRKDADIENKSADLDEVVYEGLAVGPGIAIGCVFMHDAGAVTAPEFRISTGRIEAECRRFEKATAAASNQLAKLQQKAQALPPGAAEELGYLLEAYQQMLKGSRLIRGVDRRIREDRINAEAAVQREIDEIVAGFAAMDDAYLAARVEDVREVGRRILRQLTKTHYRPFSTLPRGSIILAEELTPADTALLSPDRVGGFATVLGGAESHTAIMARSLGLPAALGVAGLIANVNRGDTAIVDGCNGRVILRPRPETLKQYRQSRATFLRQRRNWHSLKNVPAITLDGAAVTLQANIELPPETEGAKDNGAQGIGLLRSEFMFMNRADLPSEDEQYEILRDVVSRMDGRPVTIRTLDAGSDKLAPALGIATGTNPALGLRAIRLSMSRPELLDTQLSAILRAGAHGPVRVLLPMVVTVEEVRHVRSALARVAAELRDRNIAIAQQMPALGVMIEVPGAALAADALAMHADFFAIGTNDLTQYTLAIDRADEAVAHLYNPLHPAVLRLIQFATEAALRARIPISVCGEIAGDPRFTPLLLGLGIRDLSMSANSIPPVKNRVRNLDLVAATRRARVIMDQSDPARIAQLLDEAIAKTS